MPEAIGGIGQGAAEGQPVCDEGPSQRWSSEPGTCWDSPWEGAVSDMSISAPDAITPTLCSDAVGASQDAIACSSPAPPTVRWRKRKLAKSAVIRRKCFMVTGIHPNETQVQPPTPRGRDHDYNV